MQATPLSLGPVALTTTLTTNILNGAISSLSGPVGITLQQPFIKINRIRVVNKTSSAATFSLWKGATGANAAGTEIVGQGTSVAANSYVDIWGPFYFKSGDFLVGGSGTATALTIEAVGEIAFVSPIS